VNIVGITTAFLLAIIITTYSSVVLHKRLEQSSVLYLSFHSEVHKNNEARAHKAFAKAEKKILKDETTASTQESKTPLSQEEFKIFLQKLFSIYYKDLFKRSPYAKEKILAAIIEFSNKTFYLASAKSPQGYDLSTLSFPERHLHSIYYDILMGKEDTETSSGFPSLCSLVGITKEKSLYIRKTKKTAPFIKAK
jgi:hypothetical protein